MISAVAAGFAVHAPAQQRYRDGDAKYEVTITNLTRGQRFTPVLAVTHRPDVRLFQLGERASDPLRALAEEGDVMPFRNLLTATRGVGDVQMTPAPPPLDRLLGPGKSVKLMIDAPEGTRYLSLAAMLIPTNDGFVALDTVPLPRNGEAVYYAMAYDAGTEMNDEKCASIPGPGYPECGGDGGGARIGNGEGFVHIHSGIHGVGSFMPAMRDWQNPVALIRITRMED
ncbi:MAG: spondin domain-containing protein [Bryobacter sp.]|nr:spondin domain-containing protein [Bryobacter sp.]